MFYALICMVVICSGLAYYQPNMSSSVPYYSFINKIITTLNIKERLASSPDMDFDDNSSFIKPFITVAREPGSGGAPVAKAVAEKLGFTYVDDLIVEEIAKSTKKRKAIIEAIDERSRTRINDMVHSFLNPEYVDELKYLTELVRLTLTYALKGQVVILGRGANFITPFAKGLHVNITAPYDVRVQRAMDFEGLTKEQAREVIRKVEEERNNFVKQYLRQDIRKRNSYDLTINTTYFRVNETRDIIIEAFYRKFSRSVAYGSRVKRPV